MIEQMPLIVTKWGFDSVDVIAIFMGQVSQECGAGLDGLAKPRDMLVALGPKLCQGGAKSGQIEIARRNCA